MLQPATVLVATRDEVVVVVGVLVMVGVESSGAAFRSMTSTEGFRGEDIARDAIIRRRNDDSDWCMLDTILLDSCDCSYQFSRINEAWSSNSENRQLESLYI